MTEAEWLSGSDPAPLLRFAEPRLTDRLRLLFMAGCCRRIRGLFTDRRFRRVVEVAEAVADGRATNDELEAVAAAVPRPGFAPPSPLGLEPPAREDWVMGRVNSASAVSPSGRGMGRGWVQAS
ncbi:MAG: hypothetical protein JWO38_8306 [Gemmataceae bacterium]|nr:hypothetical protein [Gemmataceae bacterium]